MKTIFKIGGSILDLEYSNSNIKIIPSVINAIIHHKKYFNVSEINIVFGNSLIGDIIKIINKKYCTNKYNKFKNYAQNFNKDLFDSFTKSKMNYFLSSDSSDKYILELANKKNIDVVIFIKRTDGIYRFSPYRDYNKPLFQYHKTQLENKKFSTITIKDFKNECDLKGGFDDFNDHLLEPVAVEYLLKENKTIRYIYVIHGYLKEMYHYDYARKLFSHKITKEKIYHDYFQKILNEQIIYCLNKKTKYLDTNLSRIDCKK